MKTRWCGKIRERASLCCGCLTLRILHSSSANIALCRHPAFTSLFVLHPTKQHTLQLTAWRAGPFSVAVDQILDVSGDGGVTKRTLRPGFGYQHDPPPPHSYCKIAFSMKTDLGVILADRQTKPMEFMLGLDRPEVIPGWELALSTMRPNEIAEIVCRSDYAFGAAGYEDKIPANATIITRMQLLSWRTLKDAGSTTEQDTHELSRKWRADLAEGSSPLSGWAAPRTAATIDQQAEQKAGQSSMPSLPVAGNGGPLAEAQAAMLTSLRQKPDAAPAQDGPTASVRPFVEQMQEETPKPRVDLNDPRTLERLNRNQVVLGTAPQYRWKERQEHMELVVPVPEHLDKKDVLVRLKPHSLKVGFRTANGREKWIAAGELFGPIEVGKSFWVLSRDFSDELTDGQTCIELRLEKKPPLRRIWATVFKGQ